MEDNVKAFPGGPQSVDNDVATENSVLSALLNAEGHPLDCREAVLEVFAGSRGRVFVHPLNRRIFDAFVQCLADSKPSTPHGVTDVLRKEGDLDDEIMDRVYAISGSAGGPVEAVRGAKVLHDLYRRRIVAASMENGARLVRSGTHDADVAISDAFSEVSLAVEAGEVPDTRFEKARLVEEGLGEILGLRDRIPGIPLGVMTDLTERTSGMYPHNMTAVAARSGNGKTVFGSNVGRNTAIREQIPTVFFSLEMTPGDLLQRAASAELAIPYKRIRENNLTTEEKERIGRFAEREYENDNFRVEYVPGATAGELHLLARKSIRDMGAQVVIVDYAQSVQSDKGTAEENAKMSETIPRINDIAAKLGPHVLLLAQLKKPTQGREGEAPGINDILYGTKIENVATTVILIHRLHVEGKPGSETEFHTVKARKGTLGVDEAKFDGDRQRFLPANASLSVNWDNR